jgi:MORN repeat variant
MRNLLFIALFFFAMRSMAACKESLDDSRHCFENGKVRSSKVTGEGGEIVRRTFYENGNLKEEIREQGNFRLRSLFFDDGKLKSAAAYEGGAQLTSEGAPPTEGWVREYSPEGRLRSERRYREGKLDGISKTFDETGKLKVREEFTEGRRSSLLAYDDEGRVFKAEEYHDDGSRK